MAIGANPNGANPASAPKTVTEDAATQGPNFVKIQNTDMLTSNVGGLDVYNERNDNIGKIQDVAFDASKQMTGYILSVGGFLGMGTHYVAVGPIRRRKQDVTGDHEREQGPAQGRAGIQVRRPVGGQ